MLARRSTGRLCKAWCIELRFPVLYPFGLSDSILPGRELTVSGRECGRKARANEERRTTRRGPGQRQNGRMYIDSTRRGVCSAAREQLNIAFVEEIARRKHGDQTAGRCRNHTFGREGGSDETETKEARVTVVCLRDAEPNRYGERPILQSIERNGIASGRSGQL